MGLLASIFSSNERELRKLWHLVSQVNALEPQIQSLSDNQLRGKSDEFKQRLTNGETLDDVMIEAFAVLREAAVRTIGLRPFDVQLIGGMVLHRGSIAEMKTGEGKTLVAVLPLYLNSLLGRGAHLVTPNDYLSRYGVVWMGPIYHFLGVSVGCIRGQSPETGESGGSYIFDPDYIAEDTREWDKLRPVGRQDAYAADITYGTNNEFGFDYLRDNMAYSAEELAQRDLYYAIVDEADSILIDEARTPLIISGIPEEPTDLYYRLDRIVRRLRSETDFTVDEKAHSAVFTEDGQRKVEEGLGMARGSVFGSEEALDESEGVLSLAENAQELVQYASAALKAHTLFKKDIDYVIRDGEIIIVDEFTGRLMFGRRYSDGLHQAIEAKENVEIKTETQTVATITFQNYFRLYEKLSGMTGTAKTEEDELRKIYALDVMAIPTNRPMVRKDYPDIVFKTEEFKFRGLVLEILQCYAGQQPVLVGTRSIEVSERLSERLLSERLQLLAATVLLRSKLDDAKNIEKEQREHYHALLNRNFDQMGVRDLDGLFKKLGLKDDMTRPENVQHLAKLINVPNDCLDKLTEALREGIPHNVLNAKFHEMEAQIISEAGRLGVVTIATNMAGRGVDIILGGKVEGPTIGVRSAEAEEVVKRGGLHIIGSERHESRRIDNQLRGRSGRQGDPGSSRFYVSFEDYLMRLFGDKSKSFLLSGWREDQPFDHKVLSMAIERAQKKFEEHNFEARKHVLEYDDVMNVQRDRIYNERRKVLEGADLKTTIMDFLDKEVAALVDSYCPPGVHLSEWDTNALFNAINDIFPLVWHTKLEDLKGNNREQMHDLLLSVGQRIYDDRETEFTPPLMRNIERHFMLDVINRKWREHLANMDFLKEGIGLRGYAGVNPIYVYAKEADDLFHGMLDSIREEVLRIMYRVQVAPPQQPKRRVYRDLFEGRAEMGGDNGDGAASPRQAAAVQTRKMQKVGRNDPCPCGSGKKYKKCCLLKEGSE